MSNFNISVIEDLKDYGYTEDGEKYIGLVYSVQVEMEDGTRLVHNHKFYSTKVHQGCEDTDGMTFFEDISKESKTEAWKLSARVLIALSDAHKVLNSGCWTEIDPRYGSEAYQKLDRQGYFAMMEKKREEEC